MRFKSCLLFFCGFFLPVLSHADWRDPTRPGNQSFSPSPIKRGEAAVNLSAIWFSQKGKRATINGKTLHQGQKLADNIRLLKITPHYVVIDDAGITKKLSLIPPLSDPR